MRHTLLSALTLVTLLTFLAAGCASSGHRLVLDPIGPSPLQSYASGTNGSLVVFSAFDPHAHFNGYPYRRYYTGYKIFSDDGQLLRTVHNDNGRLVEGPATVTLPPGTYRVVAPANGFGEVVVPVVIAAYQVTTVHLDGRAPSPNPSTFANSNPVRLPDGEIVGWRTADGETFAHPGNGSNSRRRTLVPLGSERGAKARRKQRGCWKRITTVKYKQAHRRLQLC